MVFEEEEPGESFVAASGCYCGVASVWKVGESVFEVLEEVFLFFEVVDAGVSAGRVSG